MSFYRTVRGFHSEDTEVLFFYIISDVIKFNGIDRFYLGKASMWDVGEMSV